MSARCLPSCHGSGGHSQSQMDIGSAVYSPLLLAYDRLPFYRWHMNDIFIIARVTLVRLAMSN